MCRSSIRFFRWPRCWSVCFCCRKTTTTVTATVFLSWLSCFCYHVIGRRFIGICAPTWFRRVASRRREPVATPSIAALLRLSQSLSLFLSFSSSSFRILETIDFGVETAPRDRERPRETERERERERERDPQQLQGHASLPVVFYSFRLMRTLQRFEGARYSERQLLLGLAERQRRASVLGDLRRRLAALSGSTYRPRRSSSRLISSPDGS